MYRWVNPKRCLSVFSEIKEYKNDIVLWFHYVDEDGYSHFNRIIWSSSDEYGDADFKRFIISEYTVSENPLVKDFFMTRKMIINEAIRELPSDYKLKYVKKKGETKDKYICPLKPRSFGIKYWEKDGCRHCGHCGLIQHNEFEDYTKIFCYYPKIINEESEHHKMDASCYYCNAQEF